MRSRYWELKEAGELDSVCNFGMRSCGETAQVFCTDGRGGGAHPMGWCLAHEPGCAKKHGHIARADATVVRMQEPNYR